MYFSSSNRKIPHLMFIGRWNPFHDGHKALIEKTLQKKKKNNMPILILVRETSYDTSADLRASRIKSWLIEKEIKGSIMIIPDIEGVYYGRKVGYNIEKLEVEKEIEKISGTEIRKNMKN